MVERQGVTKETPDYNEILNKAMAIQAQVNEAKEIIPVECVEELPEETPPLGGSVALHPREAEMLFG